MQAKPCCTIASRRKNADSCASGTSAPYTPASVPSSARSARASVTIGMRVEKSRYGSDQTSASAATAVRYHGRCVASKRASSSPWLCARSAGARNANNWRGCGPGRSRSFSCTAPSVLRSTPTKRPSGAAKYTYAGRTADSALASHRRRSTFGSARFTVLAAAITYCQFVR